jgi:integrase
MAGKVQHAKIESRTSRANLTAGRQPYWQAISGTRAHLGYQRKPRKPEGRWLLRRYLGDGKYSVTEIAKADDVRQPDGVGVVDYAQAMVNARAQVGAPTGGHSRMTVRDAMARYIARKQQQGQPTYDAQGHANTHINPVLGGIAVCDLNTDKLCEWLSTLAASPAMVRSAKQGKQQYKPAPKDKESIRRRQVTANRTLHVLKAALNGAFKGGFVSTNQAWARVEPFRNVTVARPHYLKVAEARRLLNGCDPDFRPLVQAALQTGCRYGELTRLVVHDFDVDAGTVHVRQSKSEKDRHVVLTEEGRAFFTQAAAGRARNALLFTHSDGKAWGKSDQARPMRRACERASISPAVGFHQLRHTWASHATMNGVPLLVVAKNLGHSDTRMVEKFYGHMAKSYITDAIRAGAPRFGFQPDGKVAVLPTTKGR